MGANEVVVGEIYEINDAGMQIGCSAVVTSGPSKTKYLRVKKLGSDNVSLAEYETLDADQKHQANCEYCLKVRHLILKPKSTLMTSIKQAFVDLITSEPMKSFKKAGVTNGDNLLTDEGREVFINWLFKDEATQTKFNTEVVQPMLEEAKKK